MTSAEGSKILRGASIGRAFWSRPAAVVPVLCLVALVVRLVALSVLPPPGPDPVIDIPDLYGEIGVNLVRGNGYSLHPEEPVPTVYRPPVYPLFLAAVFRVAGESNRAVQVAQAIIGSATVVAVWMVGALAFERNTGLLAAALFAVYPPAIFWCSYLSRETLFAFVLALAMALMVTLNRKTRWWSAAAASVLLGIAALTVETILAFPIVLLPWILWATSDWRVTARFAGLLLVGLAVAYSPWVLRNQVRFGEPIVLSGSLSKTFFITTRGTTRDSVRAQREVYNSITRDLEPRERQAEAFKAGLGRIVAEPGHFLMLSGQRFIRFWRVVSPDVSLSRNVISVLTFGPALLLSLIGCFLFLRRTPEQGRSPGVLLLLLVLYFTAVHTLVWARVRYRFPIEPYILIFAAWTLTTSLSRWTERLVTR